MTMRSNLIKVGVRNLREFGYPHCDEKNILTDRIFSQFFLGMLEDNKGKGADKDIDELITEINRSQKE